MVASTFTCWCSNQFMRVCYVWNWNTPICRGLIILTVSYEVCNEIRWLYSLSLTPSNSFRKTVIVKGWTFCSSRYIGCRALTLRLSHWNNRALAAGCHTLFGGPNPHYCWLDLFFPLHIICCMITLKHIHPRVTAIIYYFQHKYNHLNIARHPFNGRLGCLKTHSKNCRMYVDFIWIL